MVVGSVIGSGIFFKVQSVLLATGGSMPLGILAFAITGALTVVCSAQFAVMAGAWESGGDIVDYAEASCGGTFSYYLAWFMANIYYPSLASVLSWVSARYFGELFGWSAAGPRTMVLSAFFLILSYAVNVLSPRLAGKIQISTTTIKLIPIVLLATVGVGAGLASGTLLRNLATASGTPAGGNVGSGLLAAVVSTVFAYDGWIVATSINAELKDPQRNLPLALLVGSLTVTVSYVLYCIGAVGAASSEVLMAEGVVASFRALFGSLGAVLLSICVIISCLGTLNGMMLATTRGMYAIAARGRGPRPELFSQIDGATDTAPGSAVWGLFVSEIWMLYFYGANLAPSGGWLGVFAFDSSELPSVSLYALYIPIFIRWMKKEKRLGKFRRFVLPSLSILSSAFMILATVYAHGILPYREAASEGRFAFPLLFYLIVFSAVMLAGWLASRRGRRLPEGETTDEGRQ